MNTIEKTSQAQKLLDLARMISPNPKTLEKYASRIEALKLSSTFNTLHDREPEISNAYSSAKSSQFESISSAGKSTESRTPSPVTVSYLAEDMLFPMDVEFEDMPEGAEDDPTVVSIIEHS
jgi:hypothetical protein